MTPDDLRTLGEVAGYLVVGGFVAWKAHKAEKNAKQAEIYAKPTGNGFANEVRDALGRIEGRQQRDGEMLYDHIRAHANADVLKGSWHDAPSDPNSP